MKKLLLAIIFLIGFSYGTDNVLNQNSWLDTSAINATLDSATTYYSKTYKLSDGEDLRAILLVDDTAETGFADDSTNFMFGYQTGSIILNGNWALDTCWDDEIFIDTIQAGRYGTTTRGYIDSTGALTRSITSLDSTYVTGFVYKTIWLVPEWDIVFRFWFESLGALQKDSAPLEMYTVVKRRIFVQTRNK